MDTKVGSKIASVILGLVLALGLAGCSGGASSSDAFLGVWKMTAMEGEDAAEEADLELMEQLGMFITLTIAEEGKASMNFLGESEDATWEATSATEGTIKIDGESVPMVLKDGKLRIEQDGMAMVFEKASADEIKKMEEATADYGDLLDDDDEDGDEIIEEEVIDDDDGAEVAVEDLEEVHAEVGTPFGDSYATFTITAVEEDWSGDPSYVMEIRNEWDKPIYVTTKYGTFSVNGRMISPGFSETIQPGKYAEVTMWFSSDDVPDMAALVDVEGVLQVLDDDSWDTLSEMFVYFPPGE